MRQRPTGWTVDMQPWAGDAPTLYVVNRERGVTLLMNGDANRRQLTAYTDLRFPSTRRNRDDGITANNRSWSIVVANAQKQTLAVGHNAGANELRLATDGTTVVYVTLSDAEARQLGALMRAALARHATDRRRRTAANVLLPGIAYRQRATITTYTWQVPDDDDGDVGEEEEEDDNDGAQ